MEARLQRRVQRYGWDLAAADYEPLWQAQLAVAQAALLVHAELRPGERVLDVACGTGLVTEAAARAVGPDGLVMGVDLSQRMVDTAAQRGLTNARFARMDAEALALPDEAFDVVLCALGLMYLSAPEQALREMQRVLCPGGRLALLVWGERRCCAWSAVFSIVDAQVSSDVCPLFFRLGQAGALAALCRDAGFGQIEEQRIATTLNYADLDAACDAAFVGGPVALAWSRFDAAARQWARASYAEAIAPWRQGLGYRLPAEFLIVSALRTGSPR